MATRRAPSTLLQRTGLISLVCEIDRSSSRGKSSRSAVLEGEIKLSCGRGGSRTAGWAIELDVEGGGVVQVGAHLDLVVAHHAVRVREGEGERERACMR